MLEETLTYKKLGKIFGKYLETFTVIATTFSSDFLSLF